VNVVEEDGSIRDLAAAHRDPQKVQWMYDLQKGFKPEGASSIGVPNVIRTGVSEIYPTVTDEVLTAAAADPGHLDILKKAGIRSAIIVPVSSRDRVLGTITLVSTESGRQYGPADLRLAEELARRAAQSIENSRLHQEVQARVEEVQRLNEQLEDRVAERTAQLEAANKELEGFSYSVSHDLRAPLRAIDGFSRILLKEYGEQLPERAHGFLGIVREGAQQMGHLIDDLLAFARLGRQALNVQQVDMRELVGGCIEELRSGEDDRLVEIVVGELPPCQADPVFLKQVFFNLVSNALKFTRNTGVPRIEVGSFEQNGDLVYYVRDNGVGFDMKYADKLFGVFQRLHRAEDYEGTGVGLAIVQRVVHRHGGRVWAEAEVDKGATFYMTFQKGNGGD
jgi:light-regulated signal transduction histidine kinase (bacteriophytochrome)